MLTELPEGINLDEIRDMWLGIGLAAGKTTDEMAAEAEAAIEKVYTLAEKESPRLKLWLRSPLEGAIAAALLSKIAEHREIADAWLDSPLAEEAPKDPVQYVAWEVKRQILAKQALIEA